MAPPTVGELPDGSIEVMNADRAAHERTLEEKRLRHEQEMKLLDDSNALTVSTSTEVYERKKTQITIRHTRAIKELEEKVEEIQDDPTW